MSQLEVDKIIPQSGTTLTIGDSGDTITFGTGTTPQLGGNLDLNSNDITGTGNIDITGKGTFSGAGSFEALELITSDNNRVFITGNSSVNGDMWRIGTSTSNPNLNIDSLQSNGQILLRTGGFNQRMRIKDNGDISFYEDTGTTPKFFWDASAENLGIGRSDASYKLHVSDTSFGAGSPGVVARFGNNSTNFQIARRADGDAIGPFENVPLIFEKNNGSETMRIDSSGNVGIGTTSPTSFDAAGDNLVVGTGSGNNGITVYSGTANAGSLFFADGTGSAAAKADGYIQYEHNNQALAIATGGGSEAMRIDSTGNLMVGTTSVTGLSTGTAASDGSSMVYNGGFFGQKSGDAVIYCSKPSGYTSSTMIAFYSLGSIDGTISTSGTSVSYNTTSDYRLKENVADVTDGITRVKQLAPKRFNFISNPDKTVDGFLAHEVSDIVPEAITGTKDEVDADGNPVYQGIDQSKLVPLLTASLKEAINKIEQLEARISALET